MKNKLDYSKWQNWSWMSENRYFLFSFTQNLFGEWITTKKWGGRHTRIHRSQSELCNDREKAVKTFAEIHKKRISHGYRLISEV